MTKMAIETATGASKLVHDEYVPLAGEVLKEVEVSEPSVVDITEEVSEPEPEAEAAEEEEAEVEPLPSEDEEIDD